MIRRPPRSTRTDTLFPYTTLVRAAVANPVKRLDQQGAASPPCRILPLLRRKTAGRTDDHRRPRPDSPQHQRWPRKSVIPHPPARRHMPHREPGKGGRAGTRAGDRSEEHTSELQSLMRISYAVFCLKKKKKEAKNG